MTMRKELPTALPTTFTTREAAALGVRGNRLWAKDLTHGGYGIRYRGTEEPDLRARLRPLLALAPKNWVSHATAATLYGLHVPSRLTDDPLIHLTARSTRWSVERAGVRGHCQRLTEAELSDFDGLPILTPARTWFDLLRVLGRDQAICLGDQLVRLPRARFEDRTEPWATLDELQVVVDANGSRPGVRRARDLLPWIRVGSDSPQETRLRLAIIRAGLPEPGLQVPLDPDRPDGWTADVGYRQRKIALQYEGEHHFCPERAGVDIQRDEAFRGEGWTVILASSEDARSGFSRVVRRLAPLISWGRSQRPEARDCA